MSERILLPLDGSKLGEAALSYVQELISKLAPGEKIEISLFHVITATRHTLHFQGGWEAVSVPYNEEELTKMKDEAKNYLQEVSKGLQNAKVTIRCLVSANESAADAIIEAEQEVNADLVAMSTHGRSGISRFTVGSVAEKVLRGGSVPVLMVRASES